MYTNESRNGKKVRACTRTNHEIIENLEKFGHEHERTKFSRTKVHCLVATKQLAITLL